MDIMATMERGKLKLSLDITIMATMEREKLKLSLDITMDIMATMERGKLKLNLVIIIMATMEREKQKLSLDITMDIMERERQNQDITIMDIMATMESNFSPKIFSKLKRIRWNAFKRNTHLISKMKQNYTNKKVKLTNTISYQLYFACLSCMLSFQQGIHMLYE